MSPASVSDDRIKMLAVLSGMMAEDAFQRGNKEYVDQMIEAANASKQEIYETGEKPLGDWGPGQAPFRRALDGQRKTTCTTRSISRENSTVECTISKMPLGARLRRWAMSSACCE